MNVRFLIGFSALLLVFAPVSCSMGGGDEETGGGSVPTGVSARAQSSTTIYINWTGIINADKYTVYRVSNAGNQQFDVFNAYDYTDTGLAPDTLYSYQVSATKGGIEGSKSSTVSQKTFPAGTISVPGAVTGIATSVSGNSVTITWGTESGAASYTLERGTGSSGPWTEIYRGSSTTYTDSGLAAGTWYYHAAASNSSGMGPWSTSRVAVISGGSGTGPGTDPGVNPPSGIPGYLTVVTTTKDSATLSWNAVEGAAGYKVYRSDTETGTYTETGAGSFSGTGFTNTGLTANTEYWYKVAAYNAGGVGPKSIVPVKAVTPANIGTIPGEYSTLAHKLAWIATQYDNGVVYDIELSANESLHATAVTTSGKNVTVNLHSPSAGDIKTLSLSTSTGYLFTVSANMTLKLENITLRGSASNDVALVRIGSGGQMIIDTGAEITGNTNAGWTSLGGGVFVDGGTLTMRGGKINGNKTEQNIALGGGVYVGANGRFTMHGGIISDNHVPDNWPYYGGGVYIDSGGSFVKTPLSPGGPSGVIYGNDGAEGLANTAGQGNGHAVFYDASGGGKKRDTTLGGFDEISTDNVNIGWD